MRTNIEGLTFAEWFYDSENSLWEPDVYPAELRAPVKPFVVHEQSIGYGRTVLSAHSGRFANFLIEVDSADYKAHTEALKACTESETTIHPGDWT